MTSESNEEQKDNTEERGWLDIKYFVPLQTTKGTARQSFWSSRIPQKNINICQWFRSPRGGGGTPLYGRYRCVRPQRVGFFSCFGHKQGIDFGHFGHKQGIDFCILVLNLQEATSISCPPPSICTLPSSPPLNIVFNIGLN